MGQLYDSAAIYDWDGTYDEGLPVPIVAPSKVAMERVRYLGGIAQQSEQRIPWSNARTGALEVRAPIEQGAPVNSEVRAHWKNPSPKGSQLRVDFAAAKARESMVRMHWSKVDGRSAATRLRLDNAARKLSSLLRAPWANVHARQAATALIWGAAIARMFPTQLPWADAAARGAQVRLRWRPGYPYRSGYTITFDGDPDPVPGSTIVIPPAEIYFMIPTLTIVRDSDAADIGAINATVRIDANSYAWTLDATIPFKNLPLVDPLTRSEPESVLCTINGWQFRFLIEGADGDRKFGVTGCRIRGRGQPALLGSKYSPQVNFTSGTGEDASQLASDLMPGGWTLNWNSPDWLVPAGLFTYADLAPIDALAQLCNAIGSTILPDQVDKILTVQPYYPINPWDWSTSTPYADIPASFLTTLSGTFDGPFTDFNGIVVSGQNGGVAGKIKRTGTDGTPELPPVNDMLICDIVPATERGRIEIAKANKRKTESIRALLLPPGGVDNPGVFQPGQLLKITERAEWAPAFWYGQVVANSISAAKSEAPNSAMTVGQTITVERFA
jgi:hypothetical protein